MMEEAKLKLLLVQMTKIKKRGKGKIGKVLGLTDSFKEFNKTQNKNSLFKVDYKTYKAICADFNKAMVKHILYDAGSLKLPYRLGEIRIKKRKLIFSEQKRLAIDWKKTNEEGRVIYHLNDHTDNNIYRWYWRKRNVVVKNKSVYSFTATRTNKRDLAKILLNNRSIDYFE